MSTLSIHMCHEKQFSGPKGHRYNLGMIENTSVRYKKHFVCTRTIGVSVPSLPNSEMKSTWKVHNPRAAYRWIMYSP